MDCCGLRVEQRRGATDPFLLAFAGPIVGEFDLSGMNPNYLQFKLADVTPVAVPEPATLALTTSAAIILARLRRQRA